jgi:hypothetical protein
MPAVSGDFSPPEAGNGAGIKFMGLTRMFSVLIS